jgi:hypothetical protein
MSAIACPSRLSRRLIVNIIKIFDPNTPANIRHYLDLWAPRG